MAWTSKHPFPVDEVDATKLTTCFVVPVHGDVWMFYTIQNEGCDEPCDCQECLYVRLLVFKTDTKEWTIREDFGRFQDFSRLEYCASHNNNVYFVGARSPFHQECTVLELLTATMVCNYWNINMCNREVMFWGNQMHVVGFRAEGREVHTIIDLETTDTVHTQYFKWPKNIDPMGYAVHGGQLYLSAHQNGKQVVFLLEERGFRRILREDIDHYEEIMHTNYFTEQWKEYDGKMHIDKFNFGSLTWDKEVVDWKNGYCVESATTINNIKYVVIKNGENRQLFLYEPMPSLVDWCYISIARALESGEVECEEVRKSFPKEMKFRIVDMVTTWG